MNALKQDRPWTMFMLDAEVETYGLARIRDARNNLWTTKKQLDEISLRLTRQRNDLLVTCENLLMLVNMLFSEMNWEQSALSAETIAMINEIPSEALKIIREAKGWREKEEKS